MRWNINWARETYAQRLLEYRKCERRELKILVSQKSPSFQRESEYSITSSSESTLGCNLEGEIAPDASVSSSALKHSIVLQTPPISLLPTNPGTALTIFTQLLFDWLHEMSIKATALKKNLLAACQHYKTNYGARRLSRFKVPSPFKSGWSKQAVGFCF